MAERSVETAKGILQLITERMPMMLEESGLVEEAGANECSTEMRAPDGKLYVIIVREGEEFENGKA